MVRCRLLSCVFSVCRSAQCCRVLGRKLQIGTWISTSGPPPDRLLLPNREPGAQGTMTDPFGRPPTWFLFHVDRESSGVLYARSRTILRCRYVRAFGSRSRIEGTSRIGIPEGVGPCQGDGEVGVQVAGRWGLCASARCRRGRGEGWPQATPEGLGLDPGERRRRVELRP